MPDYTGYLGDNRRDVNTNTESRFLREDTKVLSTTDFENSLDQSRLDVTEQIIRYNQLYGASDNTQRNGLSASKSLNYAKAPTLQQAQPYSIKSIPFTVKFQNQVGLFGAENMYVRIDLDLINLQDSCSVLINNYFEACIKLSPEGTVNTYEEAKIDPLQDTPSGGAVNRYFPAQLTNNFPDLKNPRCALMSTTSRPETSMSTTGSMSWSIPRKGRCGPMTASTSIPRMLSTSASMPATQDNCPSTSKR